MFVFGPGGARVNSRSRTLETMRACVPVCANSRRKSSETTCGVRLRARVQVLTHMNTHTHTYTNPLTHPPNTPAYKQYARASTHLGLDAHVVVGRSASLGEVAENACVRVPRGCSGWVGSCKTSGPNQKQGRLFVHAQNVD